MSNEIPTLYRQFTAALQQLDPVTGVRFATLATATQDRGASARMIVVRAFDQKAMSLTLHTHRLSEKCNDIRSNPRGEFVFWDAGTRLQARARATLDLRPGTADEWAKTTAAERMNYADIPTPGTILKDPTQPPVPNAKNLIVVTATITAIDVLQLGRTHHLRAEFTRDDGFKGRWVGP